MSELILRRREFPILLNQLGSVDIDYPLTNEKILSAEPDKKQYELKVYLDDTQTRSESELWESEMPSYSNYRQCFLASGLIKFSNIDEFQEQYKNYKNLRVKVLYSPDTNLFYNRILSNRLIKPEEALLVDLVQKEITGVLNKKYSGSNISEMKRAVKYHKDLLEEFINGRRKQSRVAATLALQEYRDYSNKIYSTIHVKEIREEKEENDKLFVNAVKNYQSDNNTYPVILTSDRILVDLCESIGVPYLYMEQPKEIHAEHSTPEQLCSLITNLAGALGVIQVNNMLVFGDYRGKTDYDHYKVRFPEVNLLELERDLEICRELLKLKIVF